MGGHPLNPRADLCPVCDSADQIILIATKKEDSRLTCKKRVEDTFEKRAWIWNIPFWKCRTTWWVMIWRFYIFWFFGAITSLKSHFFRGPPSICWFWHKYSSIFKENCRQHVSTELWQFMGSIFVNFRQLNKTLASLTIMGHTTSPTTLLTIWVHWHQRPDSISNWDQNTNIWYQYWDQGMCMIWFQYWFQAFWNLYFGPLLIVLPTLARQGWIVEKTLHHIGNVHDAFFSREAKTSAISPKLTLL